MRHSIVLRACAATIAVWGLGAAYSRTAPAGEPRGGGAPPAPVRIVLRPVVDASPLAPLRIDDIADVQTAAAEQRQTIADLDVAAISASGERGVVSRGSVEARLLLAGLSVDSFTVTGAEFVLVEHRAVAFDDATVVSAVGRAVAARLQIKEEELRLSLSSPLGSRVTRPATQFRVDRLAVDLPERVTPGRLSVTLKLFAQDELVQNVPAAFELEQEQDVLTATQSVEAGETLRANDVRTERRFLARPADGLAATDVQGHALRRRVAAGDIIIRQDLGRVVEPAAPVLVKPRDVVQVTATLRGVRVVLQAAEVLQSGREGEMVRVRNPETGRIVVGRVVGPLSVEIPLQ